MPTGNCIFRIRCTYFFICFAAKFLACGNSNKNTGNRKIYTENSSDVVSVTPKQETPNEKANSLVAEDEKSKQSTESNNEKWKDLSKYMDKIMFIVMCCLLLGGLIIVGIGLYVQ